MLQFVLTMILLLEVCVFFKFITYALLKLSNSKVLTGLLAVSLLSYGLHILILLTLYPKADGLQEPRLLNWEWKAEFCFLMAFVICSLGIYTTLTKGKSYNYQLSNHENGRAIVLTCLMFASVFMIAYNCQLMFVSFLILIVPVVMRRDKYEYFSCSYSIFLPVEYELSKDKQDIKSIRLRYLNQKQGCVEDIIIGKMFKNLEFCYKTKSIDKYAEVYYDNTQYFLDIPIYDSNKKIWPYIVFVLEKLKANEKVENDFAKYRQLVEGAKFIMKDENFKNLLSNFKMNSQISTYQQKLVIGVSEPIEALDRYKLLG